MTEIATPGFHHVALAARAVAVSHSFYHEVLGFAYSPGEPADDGEPRSWTDAGGDPPTRLALEEVRQPSRGRPGIGGVHHTAFGVGDEGGLLRWKRRLTDLGWAVSGPYDRGYFTSIYFRDPDGQVLEIATEGPGYAIDEPVDRLGGELTVPPQRIVRGHRDEAAIAALTHPEPVPEIAPGMRLRGIHHVSGITDDLGRAGELLEAALGLRLVKRTTNRDDPAQLHHFWAAMRGGEVAPHSAFTLFGWPPGWNRARAGAGQTRRVAFRAGDVPLAAWTEHLRGLGVEVSAPVLRGPFRAIGFRMHDGMTMEIVEEAPAAAG
jgi:glyoxalase family protein